MQSRAGRIHELLRFRCGHTALCLEILGQETHLLQPGFHGSNSTGLSLLRLLNLGLYAFPELRNPRSQCTQFTYKGAKSIHAGWCAHTLDGQAERADPK
ncbi:hypothetical protein SDC9_163189 [bioreactor metagenome]|uniref:Uncharacterized protein n=1 Tax=bioreactor metagenome TaxID=1076179 RepID=A0A645FUY8_9ZZZZ